MLQKYVPLVIIFREIVPIWPKINKFLQKVWAWCLENARYQRLFSSLGRKSNELYGADKVPAVRIRVLDDILGELELALKAQSLVGYPADDRTAFAVDFGDDGGVRLSSCAAGIGAVGPVASRQGRPGRVGGMREQGG